MAISKDGVGALTSMLTNFIEVNFWKAVYITYIFLKPFFQFCTYPIRAHVLALLFLIYVFLSFFFCQKLHNGDILFPFFYRYIFNKHVGKRTAYQYRIYWLLPLVTRKKVEGCMPTKTQANLARWGMQVFLSYTQRKKAQLLTPQCKNLWTILILKLESGTDGFKAAQDWFLSLQGLDKNQSWD